MTLDKKDRYWIRIKRVEAGLLKFGIGTGLARKLVHSYPLGVLEKLMRATEKSQPRGPTIYFLGGLKKSRVKHGIQRAPIGDEDT